MTFREALGTELWSKKTSRKALKIAGITLAVILLVGGIGTFLEYSILTSTEKRAARTARLAIEDLQQSNISFNEFVSKSKSVEDLVDKADAAAWTIRDQNVASSLMIYMVLSRDVHFRPLLKKRLHDLDQMYPSTPSLQAREEEQEELSRRTTEEIRQDLHRVLD